MNSNQIQALIALSTGLLADGRSVAALKRQGYVDEEGKLTPTGKSVYLDNVETRDVYTLVLGTALNGIRVGKRVYSIHKGAVLIALFAGTTKNNQKWYDCYYAQEQAFPIIRVLHNSAHKISITRVPLTEIIHGAGQQLPTVS
ncbi:hypothetical protein LCGC14_0620550 [marine sediment metagenome]|uniref:Uncharacterized protein n=1 Tax=marine sediment metagenome TaxID=412755 RepID=A0A0F9RP81_9ZZZZ